jgi:hypothetical protein
MKRKVSTVMDDALFRRVKLEAVRQRRPLAALLDEALNSYLSSATGKLPTAGSSVEATWGAMAASPELVRAIMEEEDDWLGT